MQELQITCRSPPIMIPENIVATSSQALLFEDYLTFKEGPKLYIFAHQIRYIHCNLMTSEWNVLTPLVNSVEVE